MNVGVEGLKEGTVELTPMSRATEREREREMDVIKKRKRAVAAHIAGLVI